MSTVIYYLTIPFLYLISILPFRLLYLLSDVLYLLVYKLVGYRKKVVLDNLKNAFPEKPAEEINKICRDFYHYFCDLILETIKMLTISPAAVEKHINCDDHSVVEHYYRNKQSVILVMGHLGNWELAGAYLSIQSLHQVYGIYHPLTNKHFDRLIHRMRTRLGAGTYPMKKAFRGMLRNKDKITATAFIADQTPTQKNAYWMTFLNQDTAIFKGTEHIAKKLDYPVLYISVIREKRGQYNIDVELLADHPGSLAENELTEMHTRRLEQDIINHPESWLWTHRRWKHKKEQAPDRQHDKSSPC